MPNELTAAECAERLEYISRAVIIKGIGEKYDYLRDSVDQAASILRKVATGELREVVHAEWKHEGDCGVTKCKNCDWSVEECINYNLCPNCGAIMDGKEGGEK